MGNYRFRLSDMIPNSWLYKLKDMSSKAKKPHPIAPGSMEYIYNSNRKPANTRKKPTPTSSPAPKHTYHYFSADHPSKDDTKTTLTHFPTPPRKSSKKKRRPPKVSSSSSSSSTSISTSKMVSASVSAGCSCRATFDSVWKPETLPSRTMVVADEAQGYYMDNNVHSSWSSSCSCRVTASTSTSTDVSTAKVGKADDGMMDSMPTNKDKKFNCRLDSVLLDDNSNGCYGGKFDNDCDDNNEECDAAAPEVELPPIMTKQTKFNGLILDIKSKEEEEEEGTSKSKFGYSKMEEKILQSYHHTHVSRGTLSVKVVKNQEVKSSPARRSTSSQGLKIRANSPRLASKKIQAYTRRRPAATAKKSVSESFAVVKSSSDPHRDFRDSMVEMIVENNLSASKDLEDLLACYLSLNSNEYHDVIVKVFEQVWFDFTDRPL